jgi:transcriptional regulator with XRE-family HTH domain
MKPRHPVIAGNPLPAKLTQALKSSAKSMSASDTISPVRRRIKSGATLRPGKATPLWNALVASALPRLKAHGAQAELARAIGLQRQQINAFFSQQTRMPDAERTLQILAWLNATPEK